MMGFEDRPSRTEELTVQKQNQKKEPDKMLYQLNETLYLPTSTTGIYF